MNLTLVAAVSREGVLAGEEGVPWEYPEDVEQYRELVSDAVAILGRRTFAEMTDPPGRHAVVMSRSADEQPDTPGVTWARSPAAAYRAAVSVVTECGPAESVPREVFVLGGATVYRQFAPYATGAVVSEIPEHAEGQHLFPYLGAGWTETERVAFETFERVTHENDEPLPRDELPD